MNDLEQILREHGQKYPLMQPKDAVKLIYQNEFGGGHLIRDPEGCLQMLRQEYENTARNDGPLTEAIGNGMVRVMLSALDAHGCTVQHLGRVFLESSRAHKGDPTVFVQKLDVLRKVTASGAFSFALEELEAYLEEYKAAGYPMVSHSPRYRKAYGPAYRVVEQKLL